MTRNITKRDLHLSIYRNIVGKNVIKRGERKRRKKKREERGCWLMRGIRSLSRPLGRWRISSEWSAMCQLGRRRILSGE